ncbi:MAG: EAL domain-containing protein [Candidatus Brocadiaceae bacterium]|nr:EAL domain-containing protein [Candidatus Brocadiaceae bacterium]
MLDIKPKILTVDDVQNNHRVYERILEPLDLDVEKAMSGQKALELALCCDFFLILMDVNMPDMDGFETASLILDHPKTKHIPVIFVTAVATGESLEFKGYKSGAVDYMTKPINNDILLSKVRIFLEIHKQKEQLQRTLGELYRHKSMVKEQAEQLEKKAFFDALTLLPNRNLFSNRLDHSIEQSRRNNEKLAIVFLDLDRFKYINDTLGHAVGDQLLQDVAKRLSDCARKSDTVARLGGDEFTLILPDISTSRGAAIVAQKILNALSKSFNLLNGEYTIGASIGISLYPLNGISSEELVKNADIAMYQAKQNGKNNYQFFTTEMNDKVVKRLAFENKLYKAVEQNEFILYYQPQTDMNFKKITGFEALIRWNLPNEGLIVPGEFIPIAEETGSIIQIGDWVMKEACSQNKFWEKAGFGNPRIAVNVSAKQFKQKGLVDLISNSLKETGLHPDFLELEITESCILENANIAIDMMHEIKEMGIHLSIDDFGVGFSSLNMLKNLPIDKLKIDRSFVNAVTTNADDATIVKSIISLAHNLDLKVIAEGVETREQLEFLRSHGCDEIQGYLVGKPELPEKI